MSVSSVAHNSQKLLHRTFWRFALRLSHDDAVKAYKARWADKLQTLERNNPTKLDGESSRSDTHSRRGRMSAPMAENSLLLELERERIKSMRNAHGRDEKFGDFNEKSRKRMQDIVREDSKERITRTLWRNLLNTNHIDLQQKSSLKPPNIQIKRRPQIKNPIRYQTSHVWY